MSLQLNHYRLTLKEKKASAEIIMQMSTPILNTLQLPETYSILEQSLPGVINSACFNEKNLPFAEELKQTEIGHLFEHIILQILLEKRIALGHTNFAINGRTSWNTKKQLHIFKITIEIEKDLNNIFKAAVNEASILLNNILNTYQNKGRNQLIPTLTQ
ncbi:MAG TPA: hypothetical protein PLS49_04260 [Candidatus Woesebacteria bacterium]|nr:hypothetical protein [Candidatus Woesebacteria bacterium]